MNILISVIKLLGGLVLLIYGMKILSTNLKKLSGGKLEKIDDNSGYLTISEGKYHQVKRMIGFLGCEVTSLKRVSLSFLNLDGLEIGDYRKLTDQEVKKLKDIVNMD